MLSMETDMLVQTSQSRLCGASRAAHLSAWLCSRCIAGGTCLVHVFWPRPQRLLYSHIADLQTGLMLMWEHS